MCKLIVFLALAVSIAASFAADASQLTPLSSLYLLSPKPIVEARLAGERIVLSAPHGWNYVQPAILNNYLTAYGDSRTANAGGITWASPTVTSSASFGSGYAGFLPPLSGNKFIYEFGYNYGIGAQSTAGIAPRATSTSVFCNDPTAVSNKCFQGISATMASGTYTATANASAITNITISAMAGTITNGTTYYIQVNGGITTNCSIVANGSNLTTTSIAIPIGCIDNTFVVPTQTSTIALSPAAQANPFFAYTNSTGFGSLYGSGTDISINKVGGGANFPTCTTATGCTLSPATDTAQVVAILASINDAGIGSIQTAANLTSMFTALGPKSGGPNKVLIVGDEYPSGLATGYSVGLGSQNGAAEVHTIPASATSCGGPYTSNYCFFVTNDGTGIYFSEPSEGLQPLLVYYAPSGSGPPFVAGSGDGTPLTYCGSINCVPSAAGQFGVDSVGRYAFHSGDAGKKVAIYYRYTATVSGRGSFIASNHNWLTSTNCASSWANSGTYAGSGFSNTMVNPGAQCANLYPWVHIAPTWNAMLDTASGNNYYNLPYTLVDGLHPLPYGGALVAKAMVATATAAGVTPAVAPYVVPTANNWAINATTQIGTGAQTSTCGSGTGGLTQKSFLSAVALGGVSLSAVSSTVANSLVGATLYTPNATYFPAGTTITCVDQTNNLLQLSALQTSGSSTIYGIGSGYIIAKLDSTSIAGGGVFSYSYGSYTGIGAAAATFVTGCGGTSANASCPAPSIAGWTISHTLPVNWYLTIDANSQASIAAGTLGVSFGMAQNPLGDGYDAVIFQLQGYAASAAGQGLLTLSTTINGQLSALLTSANYGRGICRVLVGPGPNGHLTGFTGVQLKVSDQQTGTFTAPGMNGITGQSSYTTATATAGGGVNEFSDIVAANGSPNVVAVSGVPGGYMQELDQLTPPITLAGTASNSQVLSAILQYNGYDAVSATVLLERCTEVLGAK